MCYPLRLQHDTHTATAMTISLEVFFSLFAYILFDFCTLALPIGYFKIIFSYLKKNSHDLTLLTQQTVFYFLYFYRFYEFLKFPRTFCPLCITIINQIYIFTIANMQIKTKVLSFIKNSKLYYYIKRGKELKIQ